MKQAHVYTIDPHHSFVDRFIAGFEARLGGDFLPSDILILLPSRRSVVALREAFLRASKGAPRLLPLMQTIGDLDGFEVGANLASGEMPSADGVPVGAVMPEISQELRRSLLAAQVLRWAAMRGDGDMHMAQAWRLAAALEVFLDDVLIDGVDLAKIDDLVPAELAEHWQATLGFLKIVTKHWPDILTELGMQDPVARRDALLRAFAGRLRSGAVRGPVIVAGSTGSIPAVAELMTAVAAHPRGMVVLPGLDPTMPEEDWGRLDPAHNQFLMAGLLKKMGLKRGEIEPWHGEGAAPTRLAFLRDALRPAPSTPNWAASAYSTDTVDAIFSGLAKIEAPGRREEAGAIALAMREALETPGKTAALVTPDRQLARLVRSHLARWDIMVDDSAGEPARLTAAGRFLTLVAVAARDDFAPVPLLSLLQHPLCAAGTERAGFLRFVRRLDRKLLRGPRPAGGLAGLSAKAQQGLDVEDRAILEAVADMFDSMRGDPRRPVAEWLRAHMQLAEALAATDTQAGSDRLWAGDDGRAIAAALEALLADAVLDAPVTLYDYTALFDEFLADITVRSSWRQHPRLSIWGPIEARLQRADRMILGGLNEGTWPRDIPADPWLSPNMRASLGLADAERRIGQSALDFIHGAAAGEVLLTRSDKIDGSPTVRSRWLFRIEALAGGPIPEARQYLDWLDALAGPATVLPAEPPAPRPPLEARPKRLAVTQVERWMRDPYSLYASKILKLKPLQPVDETPAVATKGTIIHKALERYLVDKNRPKPSLDALLSDGKEAFKEVWHQPTVYAFWWPRFEQVARWFVEEEARRGADFAVAGVEVRASYRPPGLDFELTATADRIDRNKNTGGLEIIDYKTGSAPSARRMAAGYAPQLPLEAMMAQAGAFDGIPASPVEHMTFWQLRGGEKDTASIKEPQKDVEAAIQTARDGLHKLVLTFSDAAVPYLSNPRPEEAGYGDYDHLARVGEWSVAEEGEP